MKKPVKEKLVVRLVRDYPEMNDTDAEKIIMAGRVRVDGVTVDKPGTAVSSEAVVEIVQGKEFVGRGAFKLQHALTQFNLSPAGLVCADVGSSTGGFTEVLLKHGAERVYAIDVGYGELDYKLRVDPRVVVMERTNARHLAALPSPISFVSIDVSFISLDKILPVVNGWLTPGARIVALVKPQFEAAREEVGAGGIVRDATVHSRVVEEIKAVAIAQGFSVIGECESPILGGDGNKEFLLALQYPGVGI